MKKITLQGFIQIPILIAIIAGGFILGGVYFWGEGEYKIYRTEKIQEESRVQIIADAQQKSLENAQAEIEKLKLDSSEAQKKQSSLEQKIKQENSALNQSTSYDNVPILSVVQLFCTQSRGGVPDIANGASGSGVFVDSKNGLILTNAHIVKNDENSTCGVFMRDIKNTNKPKILFAKVFGVMVDLDAAFLQPQGFMTDEQGNFVSDGLTKIPNNYIFPIKSDSCKESDIKLGAKLVVVGYPTVGGATVTVTEGIVSGFDGGYIKTSAKIEHGNSGGGAFMVPSGCWIGIPSASVTGEIESLGRILRWDK